LKHIVPMGVRDVQRKSVLLSSAPHSRVSAPPHGLPAFTKKKGAEIHNGTTIAIPSNFAEKRLFVGVGWDVVRSFRRGADLDVSTVFFDVDGRVVGAVYFDNQQLFGVSHSGDNVNGEGDGDDELIQLDLPDVPPEIAQMFVVVNCYSKGLTFSAIPNAFCRVCNEAGNEFIRYTLDEAQHKGRPGLIMCRLLRTPDAPGGWSFEATGKFCGGRTWMDPRCVGAMQRVFFITTLKTQPTTPRSEPASPRALLRVRAGSKQQDGPKSSESLETIRATRPDYGIVSL